MEIKPLWATYHSQMTKHVCSEKSNGETDTVYTPTLEFLFFQTISLSITIFFIIIHLQEFYMILYKFTAHILKNLLYLVLRQ